jgi:hypothetical protein
LILIFMPFVFFVFIYAMPPPPPTASAALFSRYAIAAFTPGFTPIQPLRRPPRRFHG